MKDINQCEYFAMNYHVIKPPSKNASSIQKMHSSACSRCGLLQSSVSWSKTLTGTTGEEGRVSGKGEKMRK